MKVDEVQRQAVSVERQEVPETPAVMQVRTLRRSNGSEGGELAIG